MATDQTKSPSIGTWAPVVGLGWLIPGGGHFLLKRTGRGTLLLVSVLSMFLLGLMMRGAMFQPQTGDILTTIIYCGGCRGARPRLRHKVPGWRGPDQYSGHCGCL